MKEPIYFLLIVCSCSIPLHAMEEKNPNKALLALVAKEVSPDSMQKIKRILKQEGKELTSNTILQAIEIAIGMLEQVEKELPGCSTSGHEVLLAVEEEKRVLAQQRSLICDSLVKEDCKGDSGKQGE